jgi:argininosuccinate synthase
MKKVVVAYSGGLDTSVIVKWIKEKHNAEIIGFCADLGQGDELNGIEEKAIRTGASKCYVEDLREEFVRDFIFPMAKANAIYEGTYLLGTAIARPLVAKRLIEIASSEGADAICHGATGKGNDQIRFELTAYAMEPNIRIIAPWREWEFRGRSDLIEFAHKHNIPVSSTHEKPYSMDRNLLHISFEGGVLENPWDEAPDDLSAMTMPLSQTPNEPEYIEISFEEGVPVKIDGKQLTPAKLLQSLNLAGGKHGIGKVDIVENRFTGMKSRGIYETPGGTLLQIAHRGLESITMDREVMHLRDSWIPNYSSLIYNGFWYAPEREVLQVAIDKSQDFVTGDVRLKLFKGACHIAGRKSPYTLYDPHIATFAADEVYNQADAEGFIKLNALRLRVLANSKQKKRNYCKTL